ncbi:hypothetical protein HUT19_28605 [Streptomyces sp. NA02950]|uniref:hypothetical protein n=1 Tax=Streptomyces sp. NA02950 TaxID=2742137 RepID=UPI001590454A|nr:hypothetical protein [Streptomyces sp. NA02950]QKV95207.1 hypothetical protein HUT19_28605 [Streptomyces sp. NA02950]
MVADARELLGMAQEVARLRDAVQLEARDVALAAVIVHFLRAAEELDAPEAVSLSPEMLPMADAVQEVITVGEGELRYAQLIELARRDGAESAEYLEHVRWDTKDR